MLLMHTTVAAEGRFALFPTEAQVREAVWRLVRVLGGNALLFCVVDDHVHVVHEANDERAASYRGRALVQTLHHVAEGRFAQAHHTLVEDRKHLYSLVKYVHDQTTHHQIARAPHPALWEGSSFADLIGARWIPGFDRDALRRQLPRLGDERLCESVGIRWTKPASWEELASLSTAHLVRLGERMVASKLGSIKLPHVCDARAAVVQAGLRCGYTLGTLAHELGTTTHAARRLSARRIDDRWFSVLAMARAIERRAQVPRDEQ